jgi:hypothetical protein
LGDGQAKIARILRDREYAHYEDIYLMANYLKREIYLYQGQYPNGTCHQFHSDFG